MRRARWIVAALVVALGCDPGPIGDAGAGPDASRPDGDGGPTPADAGTDAGVDLDGGPPPVRDRAPCATADCWLDAGGLGACRDVTIPEDFSTGLYAVHRYGLALSAGARVDLSLEVTGGGWSPALVVNDDAGATLYDGERAAAAATVTVTPGASGRSATTARVTIEATADATLHVFVTSWDVVDSAFADDMPATATYTLRTVGECPLGDSVCPLPPSAITRFASGFYTDYDSPYRNPVDTRAEHHGYDIDAPAGTEVFATQAGEIIVAQTVDDGLCGLAINLAADSGVTFRYCHLSRIDVSVGARVTPGQTIGLSGRSGNANYDHLHFGYLAGARLLGSGCCAPDRRSILVNAYVDGLCM